MLVALVCASVVVATARAEDLPPPTSDVGAALSSDPIAADTSSAASPDTSASAPGATDTTTDAADPTTDAADTSAATTDATDPADTSAATTDPADPTTEPADTSASTTDSAADPSTEPADTSTATTDSAADPSTEPADTSTAPTDPAADPTTDAAADPSTEPADTSATTTDPAADPTDTSATATDATDPTTDATDTASETSGAAPSDPSRGSHEKASHKHRRGGERGSPAASNTSAKLVPPPSAPALAAGRSQLPGHVASSSATPEVPSGPPTSVFSLGATWRGDDLTTDFGLGDPGGSGAGAAGDETTVVPASGVALATGPVGPIRPRLDRRLIVVCGSAIPARAHSDSEQILLDQSPARVQATQAEQPGVRTGVESGRPDASQRPRSARLPAPNDEPPMPGAPGSLLGSGSSGGSQGGGRGKADLGVLTALFSLTPPRNDRLVTLVERRRRPLHLFFFLERPG